MNIKRIRFDEFGPYRDWSFTTGNNGVQLMYGPNESGKTSLLEGMRTLLFGGTHKAYGPMTGALEVERNGESYYIGRKGKQLDFYSPGNPAIHEEPAQYWWHGIDKKTYNRIFALTLEDLQGLDVLQEVEVRSRFFGAEGGEHLGSVVKDVEKGTSISYGGTFVAPKKMRIATIPVGYGDGYPRSLSNKGYVLIHGKRADIVGRVCMDQFMVDVTEIPEAKFMDPVTLVGKDKDAIIRVEDLSDLSGRFNYEFVCDLSKRVPREYYKNGTIVKQIDYFE